MAYMAIAERVPLDALPAGDAALLVRRGLGERSPAVRDAVATKLIGAWLESCDGEPLRLVHALNVIEHPGAAGRRQSLVATGAGSGGSIAGHRCCCTHTAAAACCRRSPAADECEQVLRSLLDRGEMSAIYLAGLAESDAMGLRADFAGGAPLMGPASALFWRVVCEWLQGQATSRGLSAAHKVGQAANIDSAAAGQALEALERALPPTVADMAGIIEQHDAGGAAYRFSCGQLLALAAKCMDFADAAGRAAADAMLRGLLSAAPRRAAALGGSMLLLAGQQQQKSSSRHATARCSLPAAALAPGLPAPHTHAAAPTPRRRRRGRRRGTARAGCARCRCSCARSTARPLRWQTPC